MKVIIEEKKENPLLERAEVRLLVEHDKQPTPKKEAIHEALVKELGEAKEAVEITKIFTLKGIASSRAWAIVKRPVEKKAKHHETKAEKMAEEFKEPQAVEEKPQEKMVHEAAKEEHKHVHEHAAEKKEEKHERVLEKKEHAKEKAEKHGGKKAPKAKKAKKK